MSRPALNIPNLLDVSTTALASAFCAAAASDLVRSSISEQFREFTGALEKKGGSDAYILREVSLKLHQQMACSPVQLDNCDAVWTDIDVGEGRDGCGEGTSDDRRNCQAPAS